MDILTLTLSLLLIIAMLVLILHPLWQATQTNQAAPTRRVEQIVTDYQVRYEAVLANIRQLMFDYESGKIAPEDYEMLLHQTKVEAAKIRQQIDYYNEGVPAANEFALDTKVELMVKQLKGQPHEANEPLWREVDAEIARLQKQPVPPMNALPKCPHCGQGHQLGDAFCSRCGQAIAAPAMTVTRHFCAKCGQAAHSDDAFCVKCGAPVHQSAVTTH